jgi:hypothetical protein
MPFRPFLQVTVLNGQGKWPIYPSNHQTFLHVCHPIFKSQQHLSFTCMPPISQNHNCYLNNRITRIFYLGKKIKNTWFVFKLILDKITNIANTSFCFKSIHHTIINITLQILLLFQIHHIISNIPKMSPYSKFIHHTVRHITHNSSHNSSLVLKSITQ